MRNQVGGVTLIITAEPTVLPESTPASAGSGDIKVHYKNYSRIPAQAGFQGCNSYDVNVAEIKPQPLTSLNIPARPNKYSARHPACGEELIATWHPRKQGGTSVEAEFRVVTPATVLGLLRPATDIETTR